MHFEPSGTIRAAGATFLHVTKRGDLASGLFGQMMPSFMSTMPYSSAWATRQTRRRRGEFGVVGRLMASASVFRREAGDGGTL